MSPEQAAAWLPDSRGFVFAGSEPGHSLRLYVQSIDGGKPRPITPDGIVAAFRDSRSRPTAGGSRRSAPTRKTGLFPLDGGTPKALTGPQQGEFPLRFSPDGRHLYLWKRGDIPARVSRVEVESGRREVWKDLLPLDPSGVERISNVLLTPDARGYAYCFTRLLSDLFVVEGLK